MLRRPVNHEVPLQEDKSSIGSFQQILAALKSGKSYASDPDKQLTQAAQKGSTCWYYALARIRERHGKENDGRVTANRHAEIIISKYRKKLTEWELLTSQLSLFLDLFLPMGLSQEEIKFSNLKKIISDKYQILSESSNTQELLDQNKDYRFYLDLQMTLRDPAKQISTFNQEKEISPLLLKKVSEKIVDHFLTDLHPSITNESKETLKLKINSTTKMSYQESMTSMLECIKELATSEKNYYINTRLKNRISFLYLALLELYTNYVRPDKNFDDLSIKEVIAYIHQEAKISTLNTLYDELQIKADLSFFTKMLTDGVYNSIMIQAAQNMAENMTNHINSRKIPTFEVKIKREHIAALERHYNLGHILAYSRIVDLFDLKKISWTPKDGLEGLTQAINENGALVVNGCGIGLDGFQSAPTVLKENDEPIKIGSRTIKFWPPQDLKPFDSKTKVAHAIVVLGTQVITDSRNNTRQEYVFFLDPNDSSIPNEERTVYRMNYADLVSRLNMQNGVRITNIDQNPTEGYYAVAGRYR